MQKHMFRILFATLPLVAALSSSAQQGGEYPQASEARMRALDPQQGAGWAIPGSDRTSAALGEVGKTIAPSPAASAASQLDMFRLERSRALASGKGRFSAADLQRLEGAIAQLDRTAPDGYEVRLARFYLEFPRGTAFAAIEEAITLAGDRKELAGPGILLAEVRDDAAARRRHAQALRSPGQVTDGLWAYAEDMLSSVERGGALFCNGDMDVLPLLALQHGEGIRTDVLVVDRRLLADADYRQRIWQQCGCTGRAPDDAGAAFADRLAGTATRPLHFATSLERSWLETLAGQLHPVGLAFRHTRKPMDNIPLLEHNWQRMHRTPDAGPLSANYLLPGAVLLLHYRNIGNEEGAARTEHQLVTLARRIGALPRLHQLGVLLH
jgi:hypothetical protein